MLIDSDSNDTIAAVATPPGRGAVGIVRVSGPKVAAIAAAILKTALRPRVAVFANFHDRDDSVIDQGLALYFKAPASFTGEDVLELQGHGGQIVLGMLLDRVISLGARLAEPGEFSRRAFLNDKIDLAQAEAIADLIDSQTRAAARSATRSLTGVFSAQVQDLLAAMIELRLLVEAAIDFPEEDIDVLAEHQVGERLEKLIDRVETLRRKAQAGRLLRDGMTVVIAGLPNAGKSSLMNALSGQDSAIVTEIAGTTRDILRETISLDGIPLQLVDTAGLRDAADRIEQEGVRRAREAIASADHALWVCDASAGPDAHALADADLPPGLAVTRVMNKVDLTDLDVGSIVVDRTTEVRLSAKTGAGLHALREHLKTCMLGEASNEGDFSARQRHLVAIEQAYNALCIGRQALASGHAADLLAEDLRQAQLALSRITGEFSADDLLGEIFNHFCIGK